MKRASDTRLPYAMRLPVSYFLETKMNATVVGRLEACERVYERCFACAIRPDQPQDLTSFNGKIDSIQRRDTRKVD